MKTFTLLLILLSLVSAMTYAADLPLTGDIRQVIDPALIKSGGRYYIFSTGPGIPVRVSDDLRRWKRIGQVFPDIPAWAKEKIPGAKDIWAPDISWWNGCYHLYYAVSTFGTNRSVIGLATNKTLDPTDPDYQWEDKGLVLESIPGRDDWNAIDPNIAFGPAGEVWLAFGSYWSGIKLIEINRNTGKPKEPRPKMIPLAARPVARAVEAPCILHLKDYYYLFVSHDFCCRGVNSTYKVRVGRSRKITGPFVDAEGRKLTEDGGTLVLSSTARWRGPGHNSLLQEGPKTYIVYHAYDAQADGIQTLRISELRWNADGWPSLEPPPTQKPFSGAAGYWEHVADNDAAIMIRLLPDGKINRTDSLDTWTLRGNTLELRWPNSKAPGGAWIDTLELSADRRTYRGKNQQGKPIRGTRVSEE